MIPYAHQDCEKVSIYMYNKNNSEQSCGGILSEKGLVHNLFSKSILTEAVKTIKTNLQLKVVLLHIHYTLPELFTVVYGSRFK